MALASFALPADHIATSTHLSKAIVCHCKLERRHSQLLKIVQRTHLHSLCHTLKSKDVKSAQTAPPMQLASVHFNAGVWYRLVQFNNSQTASLMQLAGAPL